jgi:DNA-binding MarR family transcriptional regulator
MVRDAGIPLDRALFPLLVGIERLGPIGVGDLAERVGRDYTTVSRQVAKLESLGLVTRQAAANDRRVTEAIVTPKGKTMTDAVDRTRERADARSSRPGVSVISTIWCVSSAGSQTISNVTRPARNPFSPARADRRPG